MRTERDFLELREKGGGTFGGEGRSEVADGGRLGFRAGGVPGLTDGRKQVAELAEGEARSSPGSWTDDRGHHQAH
jgi:hypothetical protein